MTENEEFQNNKHERAKNFRITSMRREGKDEKKRETPRMTRWMDQTNEMVGGL